MKRIRIAQTALLLAALLMLTGSEMPKAVEDGKAALLMVADVGDTPGGGGPPPPPLGGG